MFPAPRRFGKPLHRYDALESTNDKALELLESGAAEGTLVLAEEQTRGRGRRDRFWHSPAGVSLYASLILRPPLPASLLPLVSLTAATGAARALAEWGQLPGVAIKWPNDLLFRGRKLGGILAEARGEAGAAALVVGIGMNVNLVEFPAEMEGEATSLRLSGGHVWDREALLGAILAFWEADYDRLLSSGPATLLEAMLERSAHPPGSPLQIDLGDEILSGTFAGYGSSGELLLQEADGSVRPLHFGEIRRMRMP
ncbi:MAG TPA: biotin--[acetyl-CoA-carboxylase] ligase [Candidatus Polarisedimenticolia bacterium]|nr:biotin--[acetyl-CoA-carboxylase] ligase [Candidatus Polarisedimenticolia bacterium]